MGLQNHYRGKKLEIQLNAQHLKFSNYWGYDGNRMNINDQISNHELNFPNFLYGRKLLTTEIACSLGHISIYKELLKSNFDWALILEDDAQIHPKLSYFLENLIEYKEPTLINLDFGEGLIFKKRTFLHKGLRISNHEIVRLLELPTRCHGYLINHKAVEMIDFKESKRLITVPDWPYVWPVSFQYYMAKEGLVFADDSNSGTLIGDRKGLVSNSPSYWLPSIKRSIIAYKFGVNLQLAFYREFLIKILRIYYRLIQLIKNLLRLTS